MEKALSPLYSHILLQLLLGGLVTANLLMLSHNRCQSLLKGPTGDYIDPEAMVVYGASGRWLAIFLGFVAAFLPDFLLPSLVVVIVALFNWLLAGRIEKRIYSEKGIYADAQTLGDR